MASADVARSTNFGTKSSEKKKKTGVLYVGHNEVLKPIQNSANGRREVDFYDSVFQQPNDDDIRILRNFLPRYLGLEERAGANHIKLENTMSQFKKPCIMDIKMGHVTSDPYARPEKVVQRRRKYPYAEKLGFTLSGISVYNPEMDDFLKVDKYVCHTFTLPQVFVEGLGAFFMFPNNPRKDIIRCLLHKLHKIRRWFLQQRQFVFYASSLLISYDGIRQIEDTSSWQQNSRHCKHSTADILDESVLIRDDSQQRSPSMCDCYADDVADDDIVDVRLIDFTHAFRTTDRDDNYIGGLQTLINVLHILYRS